MNCCSDLSGLSCSGKEIKTSLTISETCTPPSPPPFPLRHLSSRLLQHQRTSVWWRPQTCYVSLVLTAAVGQWGSSSRPWHSGSQDLSPEWG